jgi:hypothetical protein
MSHLTFAGRRALQLLGVAAVAVLAGCGTHDDATPIAGQAIERAASVAESARQRTEAFARADRLVAPLAEIAPRLRPTTEGFRLEGASRDRALSPGAREPKGDRLWASAPARANGALEAGAGAGERFLARLTLAGASAAPLEIDRGRALYREALPSVDYLLASEKERVEAFFVLKDERAASVVKLHLELPAGITRVEGDPAGGLYLRTADGTARLHVGRAVAVDADGQRRDGTVGWDGANVTVGVETRGLRYPVLIDPPVESVTWEQAAGFVDRTYPASAWDSARGRLVVFGGLGNNLVQGDTWEWDGTTWTQRTPQNSPAPRLRAAMAYDAAHGVTVLFGGTTSLGLDTTYMNDTWTWDGTTWNQVTPSGSNPSARNGHTMAYDPVRGRVVLFGGSTSSALVWEWDGVHWTAISPATTPTPRTGHAMAWYPPLNQVIMVGGASPGVGTLQSGWSNEAWGWNGSDWLSAPSVPYGIASHGLAYDASRDRLVLFGGAAGPSSSGMWAGTSKVTEFDGATWKTVSVSASPPATRNAAFAYDPVRSQTVLFGGSVGVQNSGPYSIAITGETWTWNGSAWTASTRSPCGRHNVSFASDTARGRVVLFGGLSYSADNDVAGDTWEWDGVKWVLGATTSLMSPRPKPGLSYDSVRARTVLFGGTAGASGTWEWDGATWTQHVTATAPSPRSGPAMVYDSARTKTFLFGGMGATSTPLNDAWVYDGNDWQAVSSGSTWPPGGTYPTLAVDPATSGQLVLHASDGTTAPFGHTWSWDGSNWASAAAATVPTGTPSNTTVTFDPIRSREVFLDSSNTTPSQTWEYDGTGWSTRYTSVAPPPANGQDLVWDATRKRVLEMGAQAVIDGFIVHISGTWLYHGRGGSCTAASQCETGFCVDGVCCDSACGGGATNDCQACSLATGGGSDGVCTPLAAPSSVTCRPSAGACDVAETCVFGSLTCPADTVVAAGTSCRASAGICDVAETCTGASAACPADTFVTAGTSCRASAGICDVAEACTGSAAACPADTFVAAGTSCRASAGICDVAEACTGSTAACPADTFVAAGTSCRASAGICDVAEACTGSGAACPTDTFVAAGTGCRPSAGICDLAESCTGAAAACPVDTLVAAGTTCRASAGVCDVAEACTGTAVGCPADSFVAAGTGCRPSAGICDVAESCTGSTAACPADSFVAAGTSCRASAGVCDVAESCTGSAAACPANAFVTAGVGCAAATCSGTTATSASSCNGSVASCPAGTTSSCGDYACATTTCKTTCTTVADCAAGRFCNAAHACEVPRANGAACAAAGECANGNCVDGVCCNAACGGQCQACNVAGKVGTCSAVVGAPVGARAPCAGAGAAPCGGTCNGTSMTACAYPGATTACRAASCASGTATLAAACDGAGACPAVRTQPCAPFSCGATACAGDCTVDTDCTAGSYCSAGVCKPKLAIPAACTASNQCASGTCVDGVCCNAACAGQCQACDVVGSVGTCTTVPSGAPHGSRVACAGAGPCQGSCNGASATACTLPGVTTVCTAARCNGGSATTAATCDGAGACGTGTASSCGNYGCGATACRTTCAVDDDCASGFVCDASHACVTPTGDAGSDAGEAGAEAGADAGADADDAAAADAGADADDAAAADAGADADDAAAADAGADAASDDATLGDATADDAGSEPPTDATTADSSGCGCRTAGESRGAGAAVSGLVLLALAVSRRRRRAA